jgi:hypothetical protein
VSEAGVYAVLALARGGPGEVREAALAALAAHQDAWHRRTGRPPLDPESARRLSESAVEPGKVLALTAGASVEEES